MNRILTYLIIGTAASSMLPNAAFADECDGNIYYFMDCAPTNSDWDDGDNWCTSALCSGSCGVAPDQLDDAIIASGKTCNLDSVVRVETIGVESTATLNILAGGDLKVSEDNEDCDECTGGGSESICAESVIDGTINLTDTLTMDLVDGENYQEHLFSGSGSIKGVAGTAKILLSGNTNPDPHEFILAATVEGQLTFDQLDDEEVYVAELCLKGGLVHANVNGTLAIKLDYTDDIAGTQDSLIKVSTNSGAVLEIYHECEEGQEIPCSNFCLDYTNFEVLEGRLEFHDEPMVTLGSLTMEPGSVLTTETGVHCYFSRGACTE